MSIGKGRNIAVSHSKGDIILFLDADMMIKDPNAFRQAYEVAINNGNCYPPIMYQNTPNQEHWELHTGGGNLFISRELFYQTSQWPEYWEHGFEDVEFHKELSSISKIYTSDIPFFHQWHPQQGKWKNRFQIIDPTVQSIKQKYKNEQIDEFDLLKRELNNIIKSENTTHSNLKIAKGVNGNICLK
jgi:glycosyltransferase involved in cell wall biosynthesis